MTIIEGLLRQAKAHLHAMDLGLDVLALVETASTRETFDEARRRPR